MVGSASWLEKIIYVQGRQIKVRVLTRNCNEKTVRGKIIYQARLQHSQDDKKENNALNDNILIHDACRLSLLESDAVLHLPLHLITCMAHGDLMDPLMRIGI